MNEWIIRIYTLPGYYVSFYLATSRPRTPNMRRTRGGHTPLYGAGKRPHMLFTVPLLPSVFRHSPENTGVFDISSELGKGAEPALLDTHKPVVAKCSKSIIELRANSKYEERWPVFPIKEILKG